MASFNHLIVFLLICLQIGSAQDEYILFDQHKEAKAYMVLENGNCYIYNFEGEGLAKIEPFAEDNQVVYGRNGRHLGWYSEGWFYDSRGFVIGFLEGGLLVRNAKIPVKRNRLAFSWDGTKEQIRILSQFVHQWSDLSLEEYFSKGTEKLKRTNQPIILPNKDRNWYKI
jgi:hypothetical protein